MTTTIPPLVRTFVETVITDGDYTRIAVQGFIDSKLRAAAEAKGIAVVEFKNPERRGNPCGCGLWLRADAAESFGCPDGDLKCKAVAVDSLGNWSVVTERDQVRQFLATEVL